LQALRVHSATFNKATENAEGKRRMRRASTLLVGLILFAPAFAARAADAVPAAPVAADGAAAPASPAPAIASDSAPAAALRRFQVGLQFLPMPLGELSAAQAGIRTVTESRFAFGAGLVVGFEVVSGLVVGVAPQIITGAKPREESQTADKEYDLMARVAYRYWIPGVAAVYAEVLPGYSIYFPVGTDSSKGFVLAGGVGCEIDLADHLYANAGLGYQKGWQAITSTADYRTSFVRVALGLGARF
jgi:hypothetical protein